MTLFNIKQNNHIAKKDKMTYDRFLRYFVKVKRKFFQIPEVLILNFKISNHEV
jgi:hypothetical protein